MTTENQSMPFELEVDFSKVDTAYPVILEGVKRVKIVECGKVQNKDKTGFNLKVVVATLNPETSIKGQDKGETDDIPAGLKLTAYHPLQDKAGSDAAEGTWKKNIAQLLEAVYKTKDVKFDSEDLKGRELLARVGIGKFEGEDKNEIKRWLPIED